MAYWMLPPPLVQSMATVAELSKRGFFPAGSKGMGRGGRVDSKIHRLTPSAVLYTIKLNSIPWFIQYESS